MNISFGKMNDTSFIAPLEEVTSNIENYNTNVLPNIMNGKESFLDNIIEDTRYTFSVNQAKEAIETFLVKDGAIVTNDDYDGVKGTINMSAFVFPVIMPQIEKVIFHNPATIVYWSDGDKTVVKATEGETFNEEIGLAMAISKKYCYNMNIWKAESHPRADFKRLVKNAKRFEDD